MYSKQLYYWPCCEFILLLSSDNQGDSRVFSDSSNLPELCNVFVVYRDLLKYGSVIVTVQNYECNGDLMERVAETETQPIVDRTCNKSDEYNAEAFDTY